MTMSARPSNECDRPQGSVHFGRWWSRALGHPWLGSLPCLSGTSLSGPGWAIGSCVGWRSKMKTSSMCSPESTPLVAANVLLDGKPAAQSVRNGRLIVDEGWAFKERKGQIAELVHPGRRIGWQVYFVTQLPQDYADEMLDNLPHRVFLIRRRQHRSARVVVEAGAQEAAAGGVQGG
jgi:hypothetical protein